MRTIKRTIVGAFIFSGDNHVLLGKNGKGGVYEDLWVIPGGGVEENESLIDAVKREMLEEVGIDISQYKIEPIDLKLTGVAEKTLKDTEERVLVEMEFNNFRVDIPAKAEDITINLEDDLDEAKWVKIVELGSHSFSPSVKQTLEYLGFL